MTEATRQEKLDRYGYRAYREPRPRWHLWLSRTVNVLVSVVAFVVVLAVLSNLFD